MRTRWLVVTVVAALAMVGVLWAVGRGSSLPAVGEPIFDARSAPLGAPGPVRIEPGTFLAAPVSWDGRSWSAVLGVSGNPDAVIAAYHRQLERKGPVPVRPVTSTRTQDGVLRRFTTANEGSYYEASGYTVELVERADGAWLYVRGATRE